MAADFDNVVRLAAPAGPELVVIRVASLDLITHAKYPAVVQEGQDDGQPLLYHVYRFIDRRLNELYRTLDGNDVLVVMSDDGIRTALEHDPQALFIAAGSGVPAGRLPGQPELRGVPRMIADFFGVGTTWPATGLEASGSGSARLSRLDGAVAGGTSSAPRAAARARPSDRHRESADRKALYPMREKDRELKRRRQRRNKRLARRRSAARAEAQEQKKAAKRPAAKKPAAKKKEPAAPPAAEAPQG